MKVCMCAWKYVHVNISMYVFVGIYPCMKQNSPFPSNTTKKNRLRNYYSSWLAELFVQEEPAGLDGRLFPYAQQVFHSPKATWHTNICYSKIIFMKNHEDYTVGDRST